MAALNTETVATDVRVVRADDLDAAETAKILSGQTVKVGTLGYSTGSGGAVTQITTRATGVTLNKTTGAITTDTTSLAAAAIATFTVTNSTVAATDTVVLSLKSGNTTGTPAYSVSAVAAGSFDITVKNGHATVADTSADVINFAVIKAVAS